MPDGKTTQGLKPVSQFVTPRIKTSGDTVGNVSGLSPSGTDPEGSKGRIDTKPASGRAPGEHLRPDVPVSAKVPMVRTRETPRANLSIPGR